MPETGTIVKITSQPIVIGRADGCGVKLDDEKASRNHCIIENTSGLWQVRDNNSSNGTFINGTKIALSPLAEGAIIKIGSTGLKFTSAGKPFPDLEIMPFAAFTAQAPPPAPMPAPVPAPQQAAPVVPQEQIVLRKRTIHAWYVIGFLGFLFAAGTAVLWYVVHSDYNREMVIDEQFKRAVTMKNEGRLEDAAKAFESFLRAYGDTIYAEDAENMLENVRRKIEENSEVK